MSLSILDVKLIDEYYRCENALRVHEMALKEMNFTGNISVKTINGKQYSYLQWRDKDKVKCRLLSDNGVAVVKRQINRREEHKSSIKHLKHDMKQIQKILGKKVIDEYRDKL